MTEFLYVCVGDTQTHTDRQTDRQTDRDISVNVYKPAHDRVSVGTCRRHTDTHRQTDRQTDIEKDS